MDHKNIDDILSSFSSVTCNPEEFLVVQTKTAEILRRLTKQLYDLTKSSEGILNIDALPELIIDNFDDEQVWQEIELQNDPCLSRIVDNIAKLTTNKKLSFKPKPKKCPTAKSNYTKASFPDDYSDDVEDNAIDIEDDKMQIDDGGNEDVEDEEDESEDEKMLKELLDKVAEDVNVDDFSSDDREDIETEAFPEKKNKESTKTCQVKKRKTVVDDKFFKMADMEEFLELEDAKEMKKNLSKKSESEDEALEDDIDVFQDIPSDDEGKSGRELCYEDFFDPVGDSVKKQVKFAGEDTGQSNDVVNMQDELSEDEGEEEESDSREDEADAHEAFEDSSSEGEDAADILSRATEDKKKSSFESRQEKLKRHIEELEEQNLKTKPWQLSGEVGAGARPENSLLEEHLDFDHNSKPPPMITEETTKSLEEIIIQRIKDQVFDDVVKKEKPKQGISEYKKRLVLNQEKSKLSLGEIYEKEYMKQTEKAEEEEEDKMDPKREAVRNSLQALFVKLDALSNFHYTPKPMVRDVRVITNLPSIRMEEVQPVTTSDATMLAPQEVKIKGKRNLKGETEKTKTDRLRERREKKKHQGAKQKHVNKKQKLLEKNKPQLASKIAKERAMEKLEKTSKGSKTITLIKNQEKNTKTSSLTSSSQFFSQLQDEVQTHVKGKKAPSKSKEKHKKSAKAFKL